MPKKFQKATENKLKPGYRTADYFKAKTFGGSKGPTTVKFNPAAFKIQHKG